jgi:hypothetical protein
LLSRISLPRVRRIAVIALGVAITALMVAVFFANRDSASARHQPADKIAVSSSTVEVTAPGQVVTLLSSRVRTSSPADLILQATAECSIATTVKTTGNDDQSAEGVVEMWVEIDGTPVPVASGDNGRVTFCNEAHHRVTTLFDDEDATIETFDRTKQANGFNWTRLNLGNGVHTIELKTQLTETATNQATADAAVGKRTLTVIPAKLANDATL